MNGEKGGCVYSERASSSEQKGGGKGGGGILGGYKPGYIRVGRLHM